MKKKLLVTFLILILGLLYFEIKIPSMPSYMPEREYLDMEIPILEAFITKDSSMIELPEGHYLFSQSLIMDGKKM